MSKLYFTFGANIPNSADNNRCLAYIKGLSRLGVEMTVLFFRPDSNFHKVQNQYPHIHFRYYWDHFFFKSRYLQYFSYILYLIHFWLSLKKGDTVYVYENAYIWNFIRKKKGIHVYVEYTENPDVIDIGGRFLTPSKEQFKEGIKQVDGVFVISTPLKEYFSEIGVSSDRIFISNIIVDSERFAGLKKEKQNVPYIAYCGTALNNKDGVDCLIRAFALVAKQIDNIQLYIIGPIPVKEEEKANIELINSLGIKDKVVITGVKPAKEIPQLFKNAEILALDRPDNIQAKYGFPTKMGEYLLTENPVVVTEVGDLHLFLKNEETAMLAKPGNDDDFANKLLWLLENHEKAKLIGERGYAVAMLHFDYVSVSQELAKNMGLIK